MKKIISNLIRQMIMYLQYIVVSIKEYCLNCIDVSVLPIKCYKFRFIQNKGISESVKWLLFNISAGFLNLSMPLFSVNNWTYGFVGFSGDWRREWFFFLNKLILVCMVRFYVCVYLWVLEYAAQYEAGDFCQGRACGHPSQGGGQSFTECSFPFPELSCQMWKVTE